VLVDFPRLAMSMAIVLSLIFILRWVARRFFPNIAHTRGSGVVRVLIRSPVTTKQQVVLLQVGRRVLVVADNGAQMNSLAEIADPDEVAELVGKLSNNHRTENGAFDREFGKAREGFDSDQTNSIAQMPDPEHTDIPTPIEQSATDAQGEIKGLMARVRGLAKQLGQS
jgi:flagellar biogenesis protein FliO